MTLHPFDKWAVDFVGPINLLGKRINARYIITMMDYLTRRAEASLVVDCTIAMATRFMFDNFVTRFDFPNILMSDQGSYFIDHTISAVTEEFQT